nr:pollen-specific leucine-rich repeat extensin-like protein 1 [Ipomoea batatas]
MGACASKPKDSKKNDAAIPEAPITPKKPDVQSTPEALNKDGEETMKEEPLVDLSEPAPEAPKAAPEIVPEPTPKPAVEETPATAVEEDKAPKVEEEKEAEAVTEVAEAKTEDVPKAPPV